MNQFDPHPATQTPASHPGRYAFVQSCWHADVVN
jgi:hypothetical protein